LLVEFRRNLFLLLLLSIDVRRYSQNGCSYSHYLEIAIHTASSSAQLLTAFAGHYCTVHLLIAVLWRGAPNSASRGIRPPPRARLSRVYRRWAGASATMPPPNALGHRKEGDMRHSSISANSRSV